MVVRLVGADDEARMKGLLLAAMAIHTYHHVMHRRENHVSIRQVDLASICRSCAVSLVHIHPYGCLQDLAPQSVVLLGAR